MPEFDSADAAAGAVKSLLDTGQTVSAYEAATRGLSTWRSDRRLLRSLGLALARLRVFDRANAILLKLFRSGSRDAETAGILARTYKDLWEAERRRARRLTLLRAAFHYYALGFRLARRQADLDGAVYTGINAATTAWLLGRATSARRWAREVQRLSRARLKRSADYWSAANLGEAALLLGDLDEAAKLYREAAAMAPRQVQWRASTRHNARLLLKSMRMPVERLDACFGIPRVLVVEDDLSAGFKRPTANVRSPLVTTNGDPSGIAYIQLYSEAGVVAAEHLLKERADVTVVLPLSPPALERSGHSVWTAPRWKTRARRVLSQARVVIAHQRGTRLSPTTLRYAEALQRGLAVLHAQRLETDVAVVPAAPGSRRARRRRPTPGRRDRLFHEEIKALLFADVHGYSGLDESQIPRFVTEFMGTVARRLAAGDTQPDIKYTWGDALYFVFSSVEVAARYALDLQETLERKNWQRLGLPADLSLRIALHVGPALRCTDPVIRSRNYTGSHVSWAARIEPVTPPGQVYASEPFAALAASEETSRITCEYVGATILAKGFGTYPLYRIRLRNGVM